MLSSCERILLGHLIVVIVVVLSHLPQSLLDVKRSLNKREGREREKILLAQEISGDTQADMACETLYIQQHSAVPRPELSCASIFLLPHLTMAAKENP